jgi:hypothetical protein
MHRAVAARILNPQISLFQALQIGGFEYTNEQDAHAVDSENVTLCQRKNQLNRRLRAFRQQCEKTGATFPKGLSCTNETPLDQYSQLTERSCDETREKSTTTNFNPFQLPGMSVRQEHGSKGRVEKNALNLTADQLTAQHDGFVLSPSQIQRALASSTEGTNPSIRNGLNAIPPFHNDLNDHRQQPSSETLASLTQTASSAGLTLDQLAQVLQSTLILSQILISGKAPIKTKQDLAVALLQNEHRSLFTKSMLLAGYSPEIIANECSSEYLQVAFAIWHKEGERLEGLMSRQEKPLTASMYELPLDMDSRNESDSSDVFADDLDAKDMGDINFIIGSGGDMQSNLPLFYPGGGYCQF